MRTMHIRNRFQIYASVILSSVLLGVPAVGSDCVSATFADEVYYSCSGALTVVPRDAATQAGKDRASESPTPQTESAATGLAEPDAEADPETP